MGAWHAHASPCREPSLAVAHSKALVLPRLRGRSSGVTGDAGHAAAAWGCHARSRVTAKVLLYGEKANGRWVARVTLGYLESKNMFKSKRHPLLLGRG